MILSSVGKNETNLCFSLISVRGVGTIFLVGMAERDLVAGGAWEGYPSPSNWRVWESIVSSPSKMNLVHFIFHRTHLLDEKFSLFINDYSAIVAAALTQQ